MSVLDDLFTEIVNELEIQVTARKCREMILAAYVLGFTDHDQCKPGECKHEKELEGYKKEVDEFIEREARVQAKNDGWFAWTRRMYYVSMKRSVEVMEKGGKVKIMKEETSEQGNSI